MGIALALASAVVYGLVDFAGGILSRRVHYAFVAWLGQIGGLVCAFAVALIVPATQVEATDLAWGALSGIGSAVTMLFLNRGLSRGAMSTVLPISAVTGVALSVLAGVVFLGEQPSVLAWVGFIVVLPALWLVSRARRTDGAQPDAVRDGLIASAGVAVQYVGLGMAGPESGLWAVAAGRVAAVIVLSPSAFRIRHIQRFRWADTGKALTIGAGAAIGLTLYLLATREELLAVAVTLASLYPAIPVLLGVFVLHERCTRRQIIGLVGAALAVVLLSSA
ncbi:DMT family transporter [Microbacterium aerolatum]|uniref:GRP family sugar transporter n=1 Tax=Microbacterium aerolatum TaxID=153731 RepID=UPI00200115A6|nr:GRP family sugar transporter [Microbacterium aerolatum]MCK3768616.1 DMT family transporter [Microbacterium aerolatum]